MAPFRRSVLTGVVRSGRAGSQLATPSTCGFTDTEWATGNRRRAARLCDTRTFRIPTVNDTLLTTQTSATRLAGERANAIRVKALAAEAEFGDQLAVALDVDALDVVEHPATATDQHQQATTAVVIFLVHLEMLGQVRDSVGQQRNLDFR